MDKMSLEVTEEMKNIFRETFSPLSPASMELALIRLKEFGCSQLLTLILLRDELNLSTKDADSIILNAEAWQAEKHGNIKFREKLEKVTKSQADSIEGNTSVFDLNKCD